MKRVLLPSLAAREASIPIPDEEAHHLIQVLRIRNGEKVEALDGKGRRQNVEIRFEGKGRASAFALDDAQSDPGLLSLPVLLEMAVLKGDAMEWTVEKAVELGVRVFQPVLTAHAVVQIEKKGPKAFQERWQKIADQALKQCGRLDRMEVREPKDLAEALKTSVSRRFWLNEKTPADRSLTALARQGVSRDEKLLTSILIGPEGGWSDAEIHFLSRMEVTEASLGPWVLRAETAALFASSLLIGSMR